jgi:hypothetical protein
LSGLPAFFLDQVGPLGVGLAGLGLFWFFKLDRRLAWALLYAWGAALVFSLGYASNDAQVYRLPACLVMAVWLGGGVVALWMGLARASRRASVGWLVVLAAALSLVLRLPGTLAAVDPRPFAQPEAYAAGLMAQAPPGALVLTSASEDTFPLWYMHFGLGRRPDLCVVVLPLTRYTWYQRSLNDTYPDLTTPALEAADREDAAWGDRIPALNPLRPVCTTRVIPGEPPLAAFDCAVR